VEVFAIEQVQCSNSKCTWANSSTGHPVCPNLILNSILCSKCKLKFCKSSLLEFRSFNVKDRMFDVWFYVFCIWDFSSNRLEGPIPPILGNLTSVTKLEVCHQLSVFCKCMQARFCSFKPIKTGNDLKL
jgi:hypothetical protein